MMKTLVLSIFTTTVGLLILPATLSAESSPQNWPGRLADRLVEELGDEVQDQGLKLRSSIFESLTDIETTLLEQEFSSGRSLSLGLGVQRRVFNNFDILDSHTVIDFFRVPLSLNIPLLDGAAISSGHAGINLNTTISLNAMNIRQVYPHELGELPPLDSIRQQAQQLQQAEREIHENDLDEQEQIDILFHDTGDNTSWRQDFRDLLLFDIDNPLLKARYGRFLNLFTHPFRLPITSRGLEQMEVGEISRYTLNGGIQLSGTVGWSGVDLISDGEAIESIGMSLSTYLRGEFQVSVMKEESEQVLVKVTRKRTGGVSGSIGANSPDHTIFDGFVVMDQNVLRVREAVIPFRISISHPLGRTFDIGYRYDLSHPDGRKAYFQAVYGRLSLSEEMAQQQRGVEKVFTREQRDRSLHINYRMKLSLIFERSNTTTREISEAIITLPGDGDREQHLFRATNTQRRSYDAIWEDSQQRRYDFITTIDEELFLADEGGMSVRLEGHIEDQYTTGRDFMSYIHEVELMTGQSDLFPRVPLNDPVINCDQLGLSPWRSTARRRDMRGPMALECHQIKQESGYGRTNFYYRLGLNRKQIEKFINIPKDEMWSILEAAFLIDEGQWSSFPSRFAHALRHSYASLLNAPLILIDAHAENGGNLWSARNFYRQWRQLKDIEDPKELIRGFAKLYHTRYFSHHYMRVMRMALPEEKIPFYTTASAPRVFGNISRQGHVFDDLETITDRARRLIDFDRTGARIDVDTTANIENFSLEIVDSDTVKIHFNLPLRPEFLYFRVDRTSSWRNYRSLSRFILQNKGRFEVGENVITIHRHGTDRFSELMSEAVFSDEWITIMSAISKDGHNWGAISSQRTRIRD